MERGIDMLQKEIEQILPIILKNYKVAALLIGGSRSVGLGAPESDYDLTVLLDPESIPQAMADAQLLRDQPQNYLEWNGLTIHWYYTNPNCAKNNFYHFDLWAVEAAFEYEKYNNTLYVWEPEILRQYQQSLKSYLPEALERSIKKYGHLMQTITETNLRDCGMEITKEIYHLCAANILLKHKKLTATDRLFLQVVKKYAKQNDTTISKRKQNKYDLEILKSIKAHIDELYRNAKAYKIIYQETKGTL